jgi:trehalose 6-phosphate synthase
VATTTSGSKGGGRLVVVSNRVSVPAARGAAAAGGLAVGLRAALRERGGLWFGWSGAHGDEEAASEPRLVEQGNVAYALLDLSREEYRGYYAGFANRALWPLCHYRVDLASFEPENYATYRRVNRRFAEALEPLLRPDDLVWVHDYHLIPLATELRALGCRQRLGFFLHIPFPAAQVFATLPCHDELGRDLAGYDVLGFHTRTDVRQFADHQTRELGAKLVEGGGEEGVLSGEGGRRYRAIACPIGVDVAEVERLGRSAEARRQAAGLREGLHGGKLVVGVDRLDYTKGIPQRLRAFEAMLRDRPEYAKDRSVTFLQISAPSREEVPEYQTLRRSIERLAGHINGRFGDHDWTPLRYVNKTYNRRALAGFFALSSACLLTPLRDGLNLVAEEYVVVQDPADPGVLVLSRFAGAAEVLDGALNVNPHDVAGTAAALARALDMPLAERQERHVALMAAIRANDITAWRKRFLAALGDDLNEAEAPPDRAAA